MSKPWYKSRPATHVQMRRKAFDMVRMVRSARLTFHDRRDVPEDKFWHPFGLKCGGFVWKPVRWFYDLPRAARTVSAWNPLRTRYFVTKQLDSGRFLVALKSSSVRSSHRYDA